MRASDTRIAVSTYGISQQITAIDSIMFDYLQINNQRQEELIWRYCIHFTS